MRARALLFAAVGMTLACQRRAPLTAGATTCASVESLHPGVRVGGEDLLRERRVACDGVVETRGEGRAVIRGDDGLELRLAGDTAVRMRECRPEVVRGRVFVTGFGGDERAVTLGDAVLRVADAALEVERSERASRAVVVRGEVSYQQGARQGQVAQGEMLAGEGALRVSPAGVWQDWTGGAATPQGLERRGARGLGVMEAVTQPGEPRTPLVVNGYQVRARVMGDLAITTVEERFFNGSESAAPVDFSMRLPAGAVVSRFSVERDGATLRANPGVITGWSRGGGPIALVALGDDRVGASVGYLQPGATVAVTIAWAEWLPREGARRRWTLPIGDAADPARLGEFSLDLDLSHARAARASLPEGARLANDHVAMRRSDWRPRGDVVVELDDVTAPTSPSARAWRAARRGPTSARHLLIDLSLPAASREGVDLALVIDTSAATDPRRLDVARAAVDATLQRLGPRDRVALRFGDLGARAPSEELGRLGPASPARREAILEAVARARPGGASDLARMLTEASAALDATRNGAVVYLGDAAPTVGTLDPARLRDELDRQAPDLRLYAIVLGAQPHPEVLEPVAAAGGGVEVVEDIPGAVAAAERVVAHAARPCLRDVVVRAPGRLSRVLPARVETWVAGDPVRFVGEVDDAVPREVTVEAREGRDRRRWTLRVDPVDLPDEGDLARRWATERIRALLLADAGRGAVAEIGYRYGVLSPASGFIVGGTVATSAETLAVGGGVTVDGDWPRARGWRLPSLGVGETLAPRGVRGFDEGREVPVAVDDGGWTAHAATEGAGLGAASAMQAALGAAEPSARACVERKRSLRPGLGGTITVRARVNAASGVDDAAVTSSTIGDAEVEQCVRRAVASLTLPPLELLGATPGEVYATFEFPAEGATGAGPSARHCGASSRLPRATRRVLWRERFLQRGGNADAALAVWSEATSRCELRWWEDRAALLDVFADGIDDPAAIVSLRERVGDPAAAEYLDALLARRYGPSWAWRARRRGPAVDWSLLLARLNDPALTPDRRLALLRAWLAVAPDDIDLRLRLIDALESAGQTREARALADRLRRDPAADARVRGRVGEFLWRAGDRPEALRAFSEIVESAPYDPFARGRLGDLLLAHGWPLEAWHQFRTLRALQPGDVGASVRAALAALGASREDEGLRGLRRALEDTGRDGSDVAVEALLTSEVAALSETRPDDPAVRAWARSARQLRAGRGAEIALRWTHPEVALDLLAQPPAETVSAAVGESPLPLGLRVWSPDLLAEGTRVIARAVGGVSGRRAADARLQLVTADARGVHRVERALRFDREHRALAFVVRDGVLTPAEVLPTEVPPARETLD
ncbi:MAG: VIT domain-containing protein [Polyangiales bacterium]